MTCPHPPLGRLPAFSATRLGLATTDTTSDTCCRPTAGGAWAPPRGTTRFLAALAQGPSEVGRAAVSFGKLWRPREPRACHEGLPNVRDWWDDRAPGRSCSGSTQARSPAVTRALRGDQRRPLAEGDVTGVARADAPGPGGTQLRDSGYRWFGASSAPLPCGRLSSAPRGWRGLELSSAPRTAVRLWRAPWRVRAGAGLVGTAGAGGGGGGG